MQTHVLTPQQLLSQFPAQQIATPLGQVQYRRAGPAHKATHVLLHGIGSASANWVYQLQAAAQCTEPQHTNFLVLAWDAPGYGQSTSLSSATPQARDYAQRMWDWLDALQMHEPVVLVGHSLGALMAASAAVLQPARVKRLVLLSPALGYGGAPETERQEKLQTRLSALQRLGPAGVAQARASAMLTPNAAPELLSAVREAMSQIDPAGYTQAAHMLAQGMLLRDISAVAALRCPVDVASGDADLITPPASCARAAEQAGQALHSLGPVGHACALQAPGAVNQLLGLSPT